MTRARSRRRNLRLLMALAALPLAADNIRGLVSAEVAVAADPEFERTVELRYQELVAITVPRQAKYLEGLQIELVLSAEARTHYDNFGLVIYDRLDGVPTPGLQAMTGRRTFLHSLLAMNRLFYVLSFTQQTPGGTDLPRGIFTLPGPRSPADFPILVGVVAVMKGIPDTVQGLSFYLKCKPIIRNAGEVTIRLIPPPGGRAHDLAVLVDDAPLGAIPFAGSPTLPWETTIELEAGMHSLLVSSPTLQQAQTTFSLDAGGSSVVEIALRETAASLSIEAPRDMTIYLDGNKIDFPRETRVGLSAGEHTIRYKLGDYSGARTFTVAEGKRYTIYLELSVSVKED